MVTIPVSNLRRFDTHRLLPAKYSPNYDSVLTRIADNDEHLQLIFELDNATNARLLAEENLSPGISARELVFHVPNYRVINAAFTHAAIDLQPVVETNAIEIMRHAAILNNGITFLTPFDIEFERRAGRLVYVTVRELAQDTQALMLIGHERGSSAIASVLAELLKTMMREAAG